MKKAIWAVALGFSVTVTAHAEIGHAVLQGTKDPASVVGDVRLEDTAAGLKIDVVIKKAPAGQHGFHIHEFGLCGEEGKAAGSHFNPSGHMHGDALKNGIEKTHAGDFGNLTIAADGTGDLHTVVPGLSLSTGKANVAGRAFILHEKADDFGQPTGNAGGRIGCGAVIVTKE